MKQSKTLILFSFLFFFSNNLNPIELTPSDYLKESNVWLVSFIIDNNGKLQCPESDFQLIVNLVYFSILRSVQTIKSQSKAFHILQEAWKGYQNVAQARLDPSIDLPYPMSAQQIESFGQEFAKAVLDHQKFNKSYDLAVKLIAKGDILECKLSQQAVQRLRLLSREIVSETVINIQDHVNEFFKYALTQTLKRDSSIFDALWNYIPQFALSSFVEAHHVTTQVTEKSWKVLTRILKTGNYTWSRIETQRASFYLSIYQVLWPTLQEIDPNFRTIVIQDGEFIHTEQLLPHPDELKEYING